MLRRTIAKFGVLMPYRGRIGATRLDEPPQRGFKT